MSNLTHMFKINQEVKVLIDGSFKNGTIKEVYTNHIIVDVPSISDHMWYEQDFNLDEVYPVYNF